MSEENIQSGSEQQRAEQTQEKPDSSPEIGGLIAESKKYRTRAQDAEKQLAELQQKLEQQENVKLKEKEEFKTLAEKFEAEVNELSPYKEKYDSLYNQRKSQLLNKLPEDQRDKFKNKDIEVLEFMIENMPKADFREPNAQGGIQKTGSPSNWVKLSAEEKRANWDSIIDSYKNKIN
tara:strand:+ start:348 stop:878 length:531 start_codon:yes stop_codon:yes gene_type:complete